MPAAVLLGCTTFSTSTLLRDGISRFAIAALLFFFFFLRNKLMGIFAFLRLAAAAAGFRVLRMETGKKNAQR
jgi:hypothetical protein